MLVVYIEDKMCVTLIKIVVSHAVYIQVQGDK